MIGSGGGGGGDDSSLLPEQPVNGSGGGIISQGLQVGDLAARVNRAAKCP